MPDILERFLREIAERPGGPLAFRFYFQPVMALTLAILDGIRDSHRARPAYGWALLTRRGERAELAREGWKSISRVALLALTLDLVYQAVVLKGLRPLEAVFIAIVLAILPYALTRGPANRVATRWQARRHTRRGGSATAE